MVPSKRFIQKITAVVLLALFAFMHTAKALHTHADKHCLQEGAEVVTSAKNSCNICDYQAAKEPCLVSSEIDYTDPVFASEEYYFQPSPSFSNIRLSSGNRGPPCFI